MVEKATENAEKPENGSSAPTDKKPEAASQEKAGDQTDDKTAGAQKVTPTEDDEALPAASGSPSKRQKVSEAKDAVAAKDKDDDEEEKGEDGDEGDFDADGGDDDDSFDDDFDENASGDEIAGEDDEFDMEAYLKWRAENPDDVGGAGLEAAAKTEDPGAELAEDDADDYDDEDDD